MGDEIARRVPPQNIEAEQNVLGAILLEPAALNRVLEILSEADFYRESHRQIFRAMVELSEQRKPLEVIFIVENLKARGALEHGGGPGYLAELADSVPTAANVEHYCRIVRDRALQRAFGTEAAAIAVESYDSHVDLDAWMDRAEARLFALGERRIQSKFIAAAELSRGGLGVLERMYEGGAGLTGLATGYPDLDRLTAGLQAGDLVVFAARPSMGKTALAMNIAANVCRRRPEKEGERRSGVAVFSLEMTWEQLAGRLLCAEARVDWAKWRAGYASNSDFPKLAAAAAEINEWHLMVDDGSYTTALEMKAKCRRLAADSSFNLGLVIVDYLQLMRPTEPDANRERQIAEISRSLKAMAKELRVPVLALSQLNRAVETRTERRPMLADLRESGAIEQDADLVAFIFREEMYKPRDERLKGAAELIIAKQRNGPTDTVKLSFLKEYTRFESYADEDRRTGRMFE